MRLITPTHYSTMKSFLFTLICIFGIIPSYAQLSAKYSGYEVNYYQSMRYGFFKPAGYNKNKSYPLVVFLHGSRDTVSHDLAWYEGSIQKENPVFVLTPKCEKSDLGWGSTWQGGHTLATTLTLKLIDSLIA